jgi:hypothetical protein
VVDLECEVRTDLVKNRAEHLSGSMFGTISTMSSRGHKREEVVKIRGAGFRSLEVPLTTYPIWMRIRGF